MVNYQQGKIYCVKSNLGDMIYIGSTAQEYLSKRFQNHINCYKCGFNKAMIKKMFDEYGYNNCYIELIENYPCSNKYELERREGEIQRNYVGHGLVNRNIAGRTLQEYTDDNKDKIKERQKEYRMNNKERQKEYRDDNKDKIRERQKEYYKDNRDKIKEQQKEYYKDNCDKIINSTKQYYENNKDKIKEYKKQWSEENKEKLREQKKQWYLKNKERKKFIKPESNTKEIDLNDI